ncbi:unnamed protein product [Rotaria magnacalcarata]|uniref:Uncharacterized protein n=1 Tax=Rotaria magnacalcarata TaxID=392030 RepID=A0A815VI08_9BILA|nr:unnamed protein product [Rotaria magnacalcarata]CAF3984374.1 unnamed protein product [Rotaria magnacalcarata]CAF4042944.1 unnamed protein product [Rotaria magnacalcarata]
MLISNVLNENLKSQEQNAEVPYFTEKLLSSLWSLNKRLNILICSILSRTDNQSNSGLVITEPDFTELIEDSIKLWAANYPKKKLLVMSLEFIRQLFSGKCRLISLRIDLVYADFGLYQYFKLNHYLSCSITEQYRASCHILRRLHIHLNYTYFLEYLIEHVPVLEKLNVIFCDSLEVRPRSMSDIENLIETSGNWFNKPDLACQVPCQIGSSGMNPFSLSARIHSSNDVSRNENFSSTAN